jgi:hypothetical protein
MSICFISSGRPYFGHFLQSKHQSQYQAFLQVYEERFERQYGFFRSYIQKVIYRYLDCGHEYILAHSCKRRHFCPSCHQKRVVEFGEWLFMYVLKKVPHRHFFFSIPKILRLVFIEQFFS